MTNEVWTMFAVVNDEDHQPVFVKYGQVGYWPCGEEQRLAWARMHVIQGDAVTAAAKAGSIFGWDVPAAQLAMLAASDPQASA